MFATLVHYFSEACKFLIKEHELITCIQIGEATAQTKNYKNKLVKSLSREIDMGRFRFLGYKSDIENWLAICDVVVISSVATEAQTRLVSQAFMMKKNVIATTVGGLPEMINHNVTGLLCEPSSPEAIIKSVEVLINDDDICRRLQDSAFRHASENMTFSKMMSGMLDFYESTLKCYGRF